MLLDVECWTVFTNNGNGFSKYFVSYVSTRIQSMYVCSYVHDENHLLSNLCIRLSNF